MKKRIKCPECLGEGTIENPDTIGAVLRAERKAAGVSQGAIARRMGIAQSTVADYESNTRTDCGFSPQQVRAYRAALKKEAQ